MGRLVRATRAVRYVVPRIICRGRSMYSNSLYFRPPLVLWFLITLCLPWLLLCRKIAATSPPVHGYFAARSQLLRCFLRPAAWLIGRGDPPLALYVVHENEPPMHSREGLACARAMEYALLRVPPVPRIGAGRVRARVFRSVAMGRLVRATRAVRYVVPRNICRGRFMYSNGRYFRPPLVLWFLVTFCLP